MTWKLPPREKLLEFVKQYRYVLVMLVAGLVLLLLPTGEGEEIGTMTQPSSVDTQSVEELEERLSQMLSQISGAGETQVILTVADDGERILAQDEKDGSSSHVILSDGGEEAVVTLQTATPSFRGAMVLCQGGNNPQVQLSITTAIAALTGLSSNKIAICTTE